MLVMSWSRTEGSDNFVVFLIRMCVRVEIPQYEAEDIHHRKKRDSELEKNINYLFDNGDFECQFLEFSNIFFAKFLQTTCERLQLFSHRSLVTRHLNTCTPQAERGRQRFFYVQKIFALSHFTSGIFQCVIFHAKNELLLGSFWILPFTRASLKEIHVLLHFICSTTGTTGLWRTFNGFKECSTSTLWMH